MRAEVAAAAVRLAGVLDKVSMGMDRENHVRPNSQIGFISFMYADPGLEPQTSRPSANLLLTHSGPTMGQGDAAVRGDGEARAHPEATRQPEGRARRLQGASRARRPVRSLGCWSVERQERGCRTFIWVEANPPTPKLLVTMCDADGYVFHVFQTR